MKAHKILGLVILAALALPMLASAEIYKWKDKNGVMRYSDMPPPANAQTLNIVGTKSKPKQAQPAPEAESNSKAPGDKPISDEELAIKKDLKNKEIEAERQAASIRARNAEAEKMEKLAKAKQAKADAKNCEAARNNYKTYQQGGRIYKINEQGQRVFEDDAGLAAGKQKAQAEMQKYCK